MKNKKIIFAVLFVLFFTILYLILAALPLGEEYHFEPEWETSILNPVETSDSGKSYFFKLSNKIGYFDEHGHVTKLINIPENSKASISEKYYATYPLNAANTEFFTADGDIAGSITEAGFPFFVKDSIFVFLPGGCGFSKCDSKGNTLWTYNGVMPITAFSSKKTSTAVGTADGTIKVFNTETGEMTLEYAPGGSDNPVILGLDITDDGNYIASVSGQARQRFVLARKENTQVKIIHHNFLSDDYSTQCVVHFTNDEKSVFYNYKNGVGIFNIDSEKSTHIKEKSRIISVEESENLLFFMGKDQQNYTVYLIEKSNSLGGSFNFTADSAFIRSDNDSLYIGKNNSLSKITITKK
ncbi:MAG: hypothetical protein MJ181_09610 [Treponema sp.]|nr:hypothetical protein [Treponema sp.]